jgi:hypothetical protein
MQPVAGAPGGGHLHHRLHAAAARRGVRLFVGQLPASPAKGMA